MNRIHRLLASFALLGAVATLNGCVIKYTLTGVNIDPRAQTFSVGYFPNNAAMVAPMLSNTFTEALKDRFVRQTRLDQVSEAGDLTLEGEIKDYVTAPASVSADEYAQTNRLTITVTVRFTNIYQPEWDFSRDFSAYADYDATQMLSAVESELIAQIVEALVDNIFLASAANW